MKCWKVIVQYAGVIAAFLITCALSVYEWVRKKLTMKTILRHRKAIALCVSVIVALSTTYALILPAITVSVEEAREMGGIDVGPAEEEAVAAAEDAAEEQPDTILTDETTEEAIETAEQEEEIAEETADAGEAVDVLSEEEQQEVPAEDAVQTEEAVAAEEIIPLTGSVYAHSLNIRAEKSLEADIVGTLEDTEIITILEDAEEAVDEDGQTVEDGWLHIQKNDGTEGYVKDEYIILENETVEEKRPAAAFAETVGAVSVSVEAPVGAFPAGTTMTVTPVAQEEVMGAVQSVVEENIKTVSAVDITFTDLMGDEIEPYGEIKVSMSSTEIVETEEPVVVHVDDEGTAAVVESQKEEEQVMFAADSFSVYVIVGTELYTEITLPGSSDTYIVTVTAPAEAKIPQGSTLRVEPFEEGSDEYEYARKAVLADKQAKGETVVLPEFGFAAMDISILNPAGEEIEPEAPVQVEFKIKSLPGVDNLNEVASSVEIQHHVETDNKVVIDTVFDGGSADAKFNVATKDEVIAEGLAVDPDSYEEDETINEKDDAFEDIEIDTSFEVATFSTYSISYYYNYYSRNIHYVDTNGNSLTPTMTPNFNARYQYLIYDIEGYEYDSTHIGSRTGTSIQPILRSSNNNGLYYSQNIQYINGNNWSSLNNDVYVVYKAKETPTSGGTPQIDEDETWPEGDEAPQFGKSSKNNGNGTNTISLSIAAGEKPVEKSTPADVIVVFDVSGSMGYDMNGQTRLSRAQTAVNNMANTLLNGSNNDVRMALVSFSTTAARVPATGDVFTDNYNTFRSRVNNLSASGGTNWEQALQLANTLPVREDAATFVVFVTDGDPTFRVSRGNVADNGLDLYSDGTYQYYRQNAIFGEGNDDSDGRNFDFAVDQVSAIAGANKSFYAIGISNDVTKVQNLTTEGGVDASHAFIASDNAAMERAFKEITESISSILGFGNAKVTDGITALTNAEMKVMQTVDPNSFKYYRYGGENNKYGADYAHKQEWTSREADGCAAASYSETDGAVHWDMGETFQLEDGVTYVVEFIVWPSQAAYDLVADLNNGIRTFDTLSDAEKAQVVEVTAPTETTTGTYALKTNTDQVNATYNKTTESGGVVTVSDTTNIQAIYHEGDIENMSLDSDYVVVHKSWNNELDERSSDGVTLSVTKDNAVYLNDVEVNKDNQWTSEKQYISAGFITKTTGGLYNVREPGHDYTVTEPAALSYYWDLTADIYRPMVIDGTLHVLIKTDNPTGSEGTDYFRIPSNSNNYYQMNDGAITLEASNNRRSVLDLKKVVTQDTGAADVPDPDATFTYAVTVTDVAGADVWFSAQDSSGATMEITNTSSNVVAEMRDGALTGYYYVASGDPFTIDIKADWTVRFINLPTGSSYSIQETGKGEDDGFQFVNVTTATDNGGTAGTVGGAENDTVTGTIDKPNNVFSATYTNKWLTKEIQIIKVDENGDMLADAAFTLTKGRETVTTFTSKSTEGETIALGKGTYCLTETVAPDGYIILSNKIYFNVNADGTVALSGEDGETDGVSYDNATVSNPPAAEVGTVTISNEPGVALPNTGGSGTLPYTLGGLALIMASALMYGFRMRRRERRLN